MIERGLDISINLCNGISMKKKKDIYESITSKDSKQVIEYIASLNNPADLAESKNGKASILSMIVCYSLVEPLEILMKQLTQISITITQKHKLLRQAIINEDQKVLSILIKHGLKLDLTDTNIYEAFTTKITAPIKPIIDFILTNGHFSNISANIEQNQGALIKMLKMEAYSSIRLMSEHGIGIDLNHKFIQNYICNNLSSSFLENLNIIMKYKKQEAQIFEQEILRIAFEKQFLPIINLLTESYHLHLSPIIKQNQSMLLRFLQDDNQLTTKMIEAGMSQFVDRDLFLSIAKAQKTDLLVTILSNNNNITEDTKIEALSILVNMKCVVTKIESFLQALTIRLDDGLYDTILSDIITTNQVDIMRSFLKNVGNSLLTSPKCQNLLYLALDTSELYQDTSSITHLLIDQGSSEFEPTEQNRSLLTHYICSKVYNKAEYMVKHGMISVIDEKFLQDQMKQNNFQGFELCLKLLQDNVGTICTNLIQKNIDTIQVSYFSLLYTKLCQSNDSSPSIDTIFNQAVQRNNFLLVDFILTKKWIEDESIIEEALNRVASDQKLETFQILLNFASNKSLLSNELMQNSQCLIRTLLKENKDFNILAKILNKGIKFLHLDQENVNLLIDQIKSGSVNNTYHLIKYGMDELLTSTQNSYVIGVAIKEYAKNQAIKQETILNLLIESTSSLLITDYDTQKAIMSLFTKNPKLMLALNKKGFKFDDNFQDTGDLLLEHVTKGNIDQIKFLLSFGIKFDQNNKKNIEVINDLLRMKDVNQMANILEILLKNGLTVGSVDESNNNLLHRIISFNTPSEILDLALNYATPNDFVQKNSSSNTPILLAIEAGNFESVKKISIFYEIDILESLNVPNQNTLEFIRMVQIATQIYEEKQVSEIGYFELEPDLERAFIQRIEYMNKLSDSKKNAADLLSLYKNKTGYEQINHEEGEEDDIIVLSQPDLVEISAQEGLDDESEGFLILGAVNNS